MKQKEYSVYIATNRSNTVLYTGVTNDLLRRAYEHRNKLVKGFTSKYNVTKLIYWEAFDSPLEAIAREKQIKAGSRAKKLALVRSINPDFEDLYEKLL